MAWSSDCPEKPVQHVFHNQAEGATVTGIDVATSVAKNKTDQINRLENLQMYTTSGLHKYNHLLTSVDVLRFIGTPIASNTANSASPE